MTYKFECDRCGWTTEVECSMRERPAWKICGICGKRMNRDYQAECNGQSRNATSGEFVSHNAGAGIGQEDVMSQDLAAAGVEGHYRKSDGALVCPSRDAFQDALAVRGMHSMDDGGFDGKRRQTIRRICGEQPPTRTK